MLLLQRKSFLIVLVLLLFSLLTCCQASPTPTLAALSTPGIGVGITDDECPSVLVQVGQQISWTNQDSREHIVQDITEEGNPQFSSGTLQPGDHFELMLPKPGTYTYECSEDGSMKGTITVEP